MTTTTRTMATTIVVNGTSVTRQVEPRTTLVDFLRVALGLTGTHVGCEHGVCGACTILLDGATVRGCLVLAVQASGREVLTIEGLSASGHKITTALQGAFCARNALQCGFCTPGILVTATELLTQDPTPSREVIREAISGHFCRCTGYHAIVDAVQQAADVLALRQESE
jgi:aerobic-type carbon monoxide dehydrogenase small subunit (CoxS/CutS family)